jgi:hypothetical protein
MAMLLDACKAMAVALAGHSLGGGLGQDTSMQLRSWGALPMGEWMGALLPHVPFVRVSPDQTP